MFACVRCCDSAVVRSPSLWVRASDLVGAMDADCALVPFELDTGEDRHMCKWIGGYDDTAGCFIRCPAEKCGAKFLQSGWRKLRSYKGEAAVLDKLVQHLVHSESHGDISTSREASAIIDGFRSTWGKCVENVIETKAHRAEYRLWYWKTYGGDKPADADQRTEEAGGSGDAAAPAASSGELETASKAMGSAPAVEGQQVAKRYKATVASVAQPDTAGVPRLDVNATRQRRPAGPPQLRIQRAIAPPAAPTPIAAPPNMFMVPMAQIVNLQDTNRRSRQAAQQMVQLSESALTVIEGIRDNFLSEALIMSGQEQAIQEFINTHSSSS